MLTFRQRDNRTAKRVQVAKHVEACKAQVVFLAESCNEATYKKLIQARVEVKYAELRYHRRQEVNEINLDIFK